jgi:hypothetical protein
VKELNMLERAKSAEMTSTRFATTTGDGETVVTNKERMERQEKIDSGKDDFYRLVYPLKDKFIKVTVPESKIERIKLFVDDIVEKKEKEAHHGRDLSNERKRWMTGFSGESACEELFGLDIIDWTVGESAGYHVSDLRKSGYDIGIKTVEWNKFHVIFIKSFKPEILVFKMSDQEYLVCGVASVETLNTYQNIDFVCSPALRNRGTKTAFTGYSQLMPVGDLDALKKIFKTL